jgi:hypothetical protein
VSEVPTVPEPVSSRRRVAAVFGLTLLEVIRSQDAPKEILASEDPSVTMPRRLGLSDVVERQVRAYREEVRRGGRMSDEEVRDLVRLVIRRPDAEEVFFRAGRILAGDLDAGRGWRRIFPQALSYGFARRRAGRRLRSLFGRRVGGFASGGLFTLEARAHVLIQSDPGGDACYFITGLCEAVVQCYGGRSCRIAHDKCQARSDALCRWSVLAAERAGEAERVPDLLLRPEPGAG